MPLKDCLNGGDRFTANSGVRLTEAGHGTFFDKRIVTEHSHR